MITRLWPVLLLVSCTTLRAPAPAGVAPTALPWDVPVSTVAVRLQVPRDQVATWGEALIPPRLTGEGSGQRTLAAWFLKHVWHYWWSYDLERTPLRFGFADGRVRVSSGLSGPLTARWDTLPGEISTQIDAEAGVETPLGIAPDWSLEVQPRVFFEVHRADVPIGISWNGNFFGETINVAGPVREAVEPKLAGLEDQVRAWFRGVDVRTPVEGAWRSLQEPRAVGPDALWFSFAPATVALGDLRPTDTHWEVDLVLQARPRLTLGPRPQPTGLPLPPAQKAQARGGAFQVHLPVTLAWSEASRWALANLPANLGKGTKVEVVGLEATARDQRVVVRVNARAQAPWPSAPVDAVLWVSGRPRWDPATQTLRVVDLALDVHTRDFLSQAAAWLLTPAWVADLEKALVWDLGPRLRDLEAQATGSLAALDLGSHLRLSAQVRGLEVVDLGVSDQGAELLTRLEAEATVSWIP